MTATPRVLVVSTMVDLATDAVVRALGATGVCALRWNTEEYPFATHLTTKLGDGERAAPQAQVSRGSGAPHLLDDVGSVWYRRVRVPVRPTEMDAGVYEFCVREARAALLGTLLGALPERARWMSRPEAVWAAEHKVLQLAAARRAGLRIPDTVVTNDPREVRSAFARFGGAMIAKPSRSGYVEVAGIPHSIYTSRVLAEHLDTLIGTEVSPVIYQPLIEKRCDVRVTIVGDRVFVAEIDSQSDDAARVDWRRTENAALPHRRADLPARVAAAARRLMCDLGLSFGALDFVRTPTDDYFFLEVNPNGQWLWLDAQLGLGITDAIAEWLASGERSVNAFC